MQILLASIDFIRSGMVKPACLRIASVQVAMVLVVSVLIALAGVICEE